MEVIRITLKDTLKTLAASQGVKEEDLILDEAEHFWNEHHGHGGYEIRLGYRPNSQQRDQPGELQYISLVCRASGLVDVEDCSHQDPDAPVVDSYSVIYSERPLQEMTYQARRRRQRRGDDG